MRLNKALACALGAAWFGVALAAQAAGQASPGVKTEPRRVALADARMASTDAARNTLKYLASCALDASLVLTAEHEGVAYEFPGGVGLAPQWHERSMTELEQRWVSACMLARTNHFGVRVEISLRAAFPAGNELLDKVQPEDRAYRQEEGTFFGNLFAERPVAYVCGPAHGLAARARIEAQRRVCALAPQTKGERASGAAHTACGMLHVGVCSKAAYMQGGVSYRQAIAVFLRK